MKFLVLIVTCYSVSAFAGMSMPSVPPLYAAPGVPSDNAECSNAGNNFRHLKENVQWIQQEENGKPATYTDGSPRVPRPLHEVAKKLPGDLAMSDAEERQQNEAVDEMQCGDKIVNGKIPEGAANRFSASSSEAIVRPDFVLAARHAVQDVKTGKWLKHCMILGKNGAPPIMVDMETIHIVKAPNGNPAEDAVVLRLVAKKRNAQGVEIEATPLRSDGAKIQYNEKKILTTAAMRTADNNGYVKTANGDPAVQVCMPQLSEDAQYGTLTRTKGNCTAMQETSGSLVHGREGGKLVAEGMIVAKGKNETNGKHDEKTDRNTIGFSFSESQVKAILEFVDKNKDKNKKDPRTASKEVAEKPL